MAESISFSSQETGPNSENGGIEIVPNQNVTSEENEINPEETAETLPDISKVIAESGIEDVKPQKPGEVYRLTENGDLVVEDKPEENIEHIGPEGAEELLHHEQEENEKLRLENKKLIQALEERGITPPA